MAGTFHVHPADVHGLSRLAVDATAGLTDLVEAMHHNIASVSSLFGRSPRGSTTGITGLVYRSVRGVTHLVGGGIDAVLGPLVAMLGRQHSSPQREATLAALNGVLGDHLAATGNPLAIAMNVRSNARPVALTKERLAEAFPQASGKLVVLLHGLCMGDLQWKRAGHDHGAALARDLGYTPVYVHYNSGLHISANGRALAGVLESLVEQWPVRVSELVIVGHSMGGLAARSACHYGKAAGHRWLSALSKLVFLGTPHHGSPLERGGNRFQMLVGISPYTAPLGRLGRIRSAGITDLRHGNLLDEDWTGADRFERAHDCRRPVPLPAGVACYAIAATTAESEGSTRARVLGDGLVPVDSALGRHEEPAYALPFEASHQWVACGSSHFDLLSRADVYERIRRWMAA